MSTEWFLDHYCLGFQIILPPLPQWFLWNWVAILLSKGNFFHGFLVCFVFPCSQDNGWVMLTWIPHYWTSQHDVPNTKTEYIGIDEIWNFSKEGTEVGVETNCCGHKSYVMSSVRERNPFGSHGCQLIINSASIWTCWEAPHSGHCVSEGVYGRKAMLIIMKGYEKSQIEQSWIPMMPHNPTSIYGVPYRHHVF